MQPLEMWTELLDQFLALKMRRIFFLGSSSHFSVVIQIRVLQIEWEFRIEGLKGGFLCEKQLFLTSCLSSFAAASLFIYLFGLKELRRCLVYFVLAVHTSKTRD